MSHPNWEIGKVYTCRNGEQRRLLHIKKNTHDLYKLVFINEETDFISYRTIEGYYYTYSGSDVEILLPENTVKNTYRAWINQPSKNQSLHYFHGQRCIVVNDNKESFVTVYFTEGSILSLKVPRNVISKDPLSSAG